MAGVIGADDRLAEQLAYYRARADEYDATSYAVVTEEAASVPGIVDRLAPRGDVLEIACGTGIWTVELARWPTTLTALDAAPEMLRLAAQRVPATNVSFVQADVFDWVAPTSYDVVFFSAWLSHVPSDLFAAFWERIATLIRPGGRVLFLDESPARQHHEEFVADETVTRTLADGSAHRVVKIFYEPADLEHALTALGWQATVTPIEHGWYVGEASRPH